MKLTKSQLKQIIKEELLQDQDHPGTKNIILSAIKHLKQGNPAAALKDLKSVIMIEPSFLSSVLEKGINQP